MSPRSLARLLLGLSLLVALAAAAAPVASPPGAPARTAADSSSVLAPGDPGYAEAMAFADVLQRSGIRIGGVWRSKVAGFLGQPRAAAYSSDQGPFAVVFFDEPDGAERVHWEVTRHGRRYRYTYHWSADGQARTAHEDFDYPQRFLQVGPWFIMAWTDSTYGVLKETLALPRNGVG